MSFFNNVILVTQTEFTGSIVAIHVQSIFCAINSLIIINFDIMIVIFTTIYVRTNKKYDI